MKEGVVKAAHFLVARNKEGEGDGKEEKREREREREIKIFSRDPTRNPLQRHTPSDLLLSAMPQFLIVHSAENSLMS